MHKIAFAGLSLLLLGARVGTASEIVPLPPTPGGPHPLAQAPAAPQEQRDLSVRVWTEDERDLFRAGDRSRVLLRTSEDAYVAVIHVDTRGEMEVIYPESPFEDGFLRGRRLYSLPGAGSASRGWTVRGVSGVGYLYAVASDEPLNLRALRGLFPGSASGQWRGERVIYGDPFAALDRISRLLVPDPGYGGFAEDWFSYHVGQRYGHPRYACYDGYGPWATSSASAYGTCDRVRLLLRDRPYYYDTRYYRGDRRVYRGYAAGNDPRHRYKERTDRRTDTRMEDPVRPRVEGRVREEDAPPPRTRTVDARGEVPEQQGPPARQRPSLERRRPESGGGGGADRRPTREAAPPRRETPAQVQPRREPTRSEPRREPARSRDEPRARSGGSPNASSGPRVRPGGS